MPKLEAVNCFRTKDGHKGGGHYYDITACSYFPNTDIESFYVCPQISLAVYHTHLLLPRLQHEKLVFVDSLTALN